MRALILFVALGVSFYFNAVQFYGNNKIRAIAIDCIETIDNANTQIESAIDLLDKNQELLDNIFRVEEMLARKVPPELLTKYASAFLSASVKYDVPVKLLISIASVESNFNHRAVSYKNAIGVMQVMKLWIKVIPELKSESDLYDIDKNINAGAFVISQYRKRFGHIKTTITAYNRGETIVARYLAAGMDPSNGYETRVLDKWKNKRKNYL